MIPSVATAKVTAERSDRGVVIKVDGELFTEYLTKAGQAPAMWPVIGPNGERVTRAWPVSKSPDGVKETDDHPHHQSVWFTHDKVNGADFWKDNVNSTPGGPTTAGGAHIVHRDFVEVKNDGDTARVVARNDWMNGEKRICQDERTIVFGTRPNGDRWIDFTITLKATDGDVTFGDTKEGTFAVRVADPMRVDAKLGGRIVNSDGLENEAAWGIPARWVDYTGPTTPALADSRQPTADSPTISGICIMAYPKSFRPTPLWHVRTYGLFTANPFGKSDFPKPELSDQGPTTIKNGDSLTLRYRILLHEGRTDPAHLNEAFDEFAAK
jgi:hypothetical protein